MAAALGATEAGQRSGGAIAAATKTFKEAGFLWRKPFLLESAEGEEISMQDVPPQQVVAMVCAGLRGTREEKVIRSLKEMYGETEEITSLCEGGSIYVDHMRKLSQG